MYNSKKRKRKRLAVEMIITEKKTWMDGHTKHGRIRNKEKGNNTITTYKTAAHTHTHIQDIFLLLRTIFKVKPNYPVYLCISYVTGTAEKNWAFRMISVLNMESILTIAITVL